MRVISAHIERVEQEYFGKHLACFHITFEDNKGNKSTTEAMFFPYNPWASANFQPNDNEETLALADEIGKQLARI